MRRKRRLLAVRVGTWTSSKAATESLDAPRSIDMNVLGCRGGRLANCSATQSVSLTSDTVTPSLRLTTLLHPATTTARCLALKHSGTVTAKETHETVSVSSTCRAPPGLAASTAAQGGKVRR